MLKIKHFFQQSWLLIVASCAFGLLLAITNAALKPMIEKNQIDKINNLMAELITDANNFNIAIDSANLKASKDKIIKTNIYQGIDKNGSIAGFAFIAEGAGFADKIKLVIAIDSTAEKILGFKVLASNETPGFGVKIKEAFYASQFKRIPALQLELTKIGDPAILDTNIVAITGATVSSQAVVDILNTYTIQVKNQLQKKELIDGK